MFSSDTHRIYNVYRSINNIYSILLLLYFCKIITKIQKTINNNGLNVSFRESALIMPFFLSVCNLKHWEYFKAVWLKAHSYRQNGWHILHFIVCILLYLHFSHIKAQHLSWSVCPRPAYLSLYGSGTAHDVSKASETDADRSRSAVSTADGVYHLRFTLTFTNTAI